ncbi:Putative metal-dependent hydrolase [Photobacterium marinum]|uniref:Putative metal-dependent hydrolase n=1 Tax=Photobacterium marinum TaxID=1056511 RepID=L8JIA6_9GAMM|nr:YgjP-like metallopeptidase domain-containing protein [Photobacterium marinum]ELR67172.1 Putative metal-dependent hydrolase [Photobacterium marinum]
MTKLTYLSGYSPQLLEQVQYLVDSEKLGVYLKKKYPEKHNITTEKLLYNYVVDLQRKYLKKSPLISKVSYDKKIHAVHNALGLHTFVSRVQGSKLKAKNEIRVAQVFKTAPLDFMRMIVIHELAHLKEKQHNKSFYNLCCHMEPNYHQLELDMRLYLTHLDMFGPIYS